MSNDLNELIARKDKLEGELHHELSADYNELMKKLSESFRDMHENSVQYYKQKANEELDKMEKNIQSGNKLSAINESHWQTHTYPSLLPFNFFIDHTIISFKTNLLSKFLLSNVC